MSWSLFIFCEHSTWGPESSRVTYFILRSILSVTRVDAHGSDSATKAWSTNLNLIRNYSREKEIYLIMAKMQWERHACSTTRLHVIHTYRVRVKTEEWRTSSPANHKGLYPGKKINLNLSPSHSTCKSSTTNSPESTKSVPTQIHTKQNINT